MPSYLSNSHLPCLPPRPLTLSPRPQLTSYGKVDNADEAGMMAEIMQRGPITCGVAAPDDFVYKYHSGRQGGVYVDNSGGAGACEVQWVQQCKRWLAYFVGTCSELIGVLLAFVGSE